MHNEVLLEDCFPRDHSITQVSSMQLLSPVSHSDLHLNSGLPEKGSDKRRSVLHDHSQQYVMRNVLSAQTLDHQNANFTCD